MPYLKMVRFAVDICAFACLVASAILVGRGYERFFTPMILCAVGLAFSIVCHNVNNGGR